MIRLHLELTGASQGLDLSLSISEHDVPSFLLEIPWCDQYSISHLDPDSTFHLATYTTDPRHTVGAFNQDSIIAEQVLDGPVHLAGTRSEHFTQVGFAQNLALSHFLTLILILWNIKPLRYPQAGTVFRSAAIASTLWNSRRAESSVPLGSFLTVRRPSRFSNRGSSRHLGFDCRQCVPCS